MDPSICRNQLVNDSDSILNRLTLRQHVNPHEQIARSLALMCNDVGCCPLAVERALQWLKLDPRTIIGRLRRTELTQLSRSIHRFWMNSVVSIQPADAPE